MASKLMGLRDDLDQLIETEAAKVLTANQFLPLPGFDGIVDAIVSAAHAEGVAEGAEQERERMVVILDDIERHSVIPFLPSIRQRLSLPIYDRQTDTSVLAPTKEAMR